jgi:hypothetical protein
MSPEVTASADAKSGVTPASSYDLSFRSARCDVRKPPERNSAAVHARGMTHPTYHAIEPARLTAMRVRDADDFGNPWLPRAAEGWEPLRCCLRVASPGEDIALISYSPWPQPWTTAWAEAGPVFVCHRECPGYPTTEQYPRGLLKQHAQLNPFDHSGARAYRHITFVKPDDDHEVAVRAVLAQPEVSRLHVRSAVAQCFTFEVRPADAA